MNGKQMGLSIIWSSSMTADLRTAGEPSCFTCEHPCREFACGWTVCSDWPHIAFSCFYSINTTFTLTCFFFVFFKVSFKGLLPQHNYSTTTQLQPQKSSSTVEAARQLLSSAVVASIPLAPYITLSFWECLLGGLSLCLEWPTDLRVSVCFVYGQSI